MAVKKAYDLYNKKLSNVICVKRNLWNTLDLNENKPTTCQNLTDTIKTVFTGKFTTVNTCIKVRARDTNNWVILLE